MPRFIERRAFAVGQVQPRLPAEALASIQIHESAVNNALDQLDLQDRDFTFAELRTWLDHKLHRPADADRPVLNEDVWFVLAAQDPAVVRFRDGRFEITLSLAELQRGDDTWTDFQVRAYYRADRDRRVFVREDVVQLIGESTGGSQMALRSIFSKIFSPSRDWPLLPELAEKIAAQEKLGIFHCVIEDGWLSVAFGHRPTKTTRR